MEIGIYYYFEVLAFITACIRFKTLLATPYKYFLPFLLFILWYETSSLYNLFSVNHSNLWAINLELMAELLFYSLFIRSRLISQAYKKGILIALSVALTYAVLSLFLLHGFWRLNISGIILQIIVLIFIIGRYFWELIAIPANNTFYLLKQPGFWLNTGLLLYYLGEFMFFVSFSYLAYKHNFAYLQLWTFVTNIANAILYSCITICFLCIARPVK